MAKPNAHIHVLFLTQMRVVVGNLCFQSISDHYERPCTIEPSGLRCTSAQMSKINGECIIKPQFSPFIYKPKSRSVAS